ncbi:MULTISPECIES: PTS transporter subunit EIIC [unclassified Breznakia]|uniref:PTS transporter subunit EIIC n=1 Tax=unclassified Breznakia TaxID=2623764 RepID=UPI002473715A|nr:MULTISPECIES: PTS transporter subunit EIIC [unclassified Breznakia]MDH6368147.1 PTS system beta-glucosides-specific IIC component [Breznakia sp. PH1-1]MDH6405226.1 PTS system beta-glucosides-specific IIC component [Breznakia sp. PF1-11]MDH6412940.1 PTS system beta-glucosides-specific IIC component [Breznakia sp. PFB1-11]MDH6415302.1 PTS system beta-glucosides-specific IIC component [Breznakia sp. PFB1-14]MDH6417611.1 PTS system beta-glucosides-specific IIC component [Breznakia sp. PFB1-4]
MKTTTKLAEDLLTFMGGEENIVSITHCATRLRPKFKDIKKVRVDEIKNLDGVTGVVEKESGFQIIIGTHVVHVYDEIIKSFKEEAGSTTSQDRDEKKNYLNEFVQLVVSIFSPLLPLLAGSGLIRGFTILANEVGILSTTSTTNLILTLTATSVFYFLPLLVAVTSAKRFKTSPYIAVAILGALIMPDFINLVVDNGGNMIDLYGISMPVFNYTSQVIPAIVMVWIQSKMEAFMVEKIPTSLHMIVNPTILMLVLVPLTIGVIGPIGNYVSIGVAQSVEFIASVNPILTGAFIGGIWNVLIMFGIHWAPNTMVVIPEIARTGSSALIAYAANSNFGMSGAAFAIFLKSKNKKLRNFSLTAITSVMLSGIVEPAIYGIGVKYKTPLIAGCLGAALGGAFMGMFGVVGNAFVFGGLTTIPAFAGATLWAYVVGLLISFVAGMVLTFIIGVKDPEAEINGGR